MARKVNLELRETWRQRIERQRRSGVCGQNSRPLRPRTCFASETGVASARNPINPSALEDVLPQDLGPLRREIPWSSACGSGDCHDGLPCRQPPSEEGDVK